MLILFYVHFMIHSRAFKNSKHYLAITNSTIQRSPQITSSLIEFSSVCIGITFLPQVTQTHTHKTCTGHCSGQFCQANFSIIVILKICLTVMLTLHLFSPFSLNYLHSTLRMKNKSFKSFLQYNFLHPLPHPSLAQHSLLLSPSKYRLQITHFHYAVNITSNDD
jgi:hypothetical protein